MKVVLSQSFPSRRSWHSGSGLLNLVTKTLENGPLKFWLSPWRVPWNGVDSSFLSPTGRWGFPLLLFLWRWMLPLWG